MPEPSSRGGAVCTPKRWMPVANFSPRSKPTCANVVLHETMNPSSRLPPHRSPPKFPSVTPFVCGRRDPVEDRERLGDVDVVLQRERRGDGLERRARRIELAPRTRQQRILGIVAQEGERVLGGLVDVRCERVGIEGRVRVGREHAAGGDVEDDHAAALALQRERGGALGPRRHGQHDGSDGLLVGERVGEVLQLEVEGAAFEVGAVGALDPDRSVLHRLVPDHVGEQRRGRVRVRRAGA